MSLDGSKVRWLSVGGIVFREVRRLLPEGTSLEKFRKMCNLRECKSAFPFELLEEDQAFLDAQELPPRAEQWSSLLGGIPDQETVDEARRLFDELQCPDVRSYLTHYLRQDVLMLGKGFKALRDSFYDLFGLDLVDSRKFTISSLSALASQAHLFRQKSVGMFSPQCPKIYSVLRKGLRGGQYTHTFAALSRPRNKKQTKRVRRVSPSYLTSSSSAGLTAVYRTAAGKDVDLSDFVRLEREHLRASSSSSSSSARAEEEEEETDAEIESRLRKLNAHLPHVKDPRNADYVNYWDIVGLYSHSGEFSIRLQ